MKKGFTLIELLAVIVILAVIALISVPLILGVIEESKKGAFKDSVSLTFSAAELYEAKNTIPTEGVELKNLSLKNNNFKYGKIIKNANNELEVINGSDGNYCANGTLSNLTINKGECDSTVPTCTYEIISGNKGLNDWYITSPTLEFTTSSANVSGLYYGVGFNENYESTMLNNNETKTITSTIKTSVNTTKIYGYVKSGSGKTNTCSVTFKTDLTSPEAPIVSGTNIVWTTSKTLTLTEPTTESGVLKYEYYISDNNNKPSKEVTVSGFTNSLVNEINTSGKYIFFRTVNKAGVTGVWGNAEDLYVDSSKPVINLTETFYDPNTSLVNASLTRNDLVKKASVLIKASDSVSGIKELKYKIDSGSWTVISGTETTVNLETPGKCKLYISVTDNTNQTLEESYDYNIYSTESYEIWLMKAGVSNTYSTIADLFTDTTTLNKLMTNAAAISYMYSSSSTLLDSIANSPNALTALVSSKTALQSLRTSTAWISKYRTNSSFLDKLLGTTVLTDVEKYNLGLPFYLYNGATTGVSNFTSFYKLYYGSPMGNAATTSGNIYIALTEHPGDCALQRLGTSSLINFGNYKYMSANVVAILQQDPSAAILMGISNGIPSTENTLIHYGWLVSGINKLDLLTYTSSYYVTFSINSCYGSSALYANTATISKLSIY